jgi:uncharacterized membrane protein
MALASGAISIDFARIWGAMILPSEPDSGIEHGVSESDMARAERAPRDSLPPGRRRTIHWHSLSDAIVLTLVVAGPTMLWEEVGQGRPMIDQPGSLWLVPAAIVTVTYFLGGAIAGRHRRRPGGALIQSLALAVSTSSIFVVVDIVRRVMLGNNQSVAVAELWLTAMGATVVVAGIGALSGRWLYIRRREGL